MQITHLYYNMILIHALVDNKPPYSRQCCNTKLHGMSPYDFLQAHVHEVETLVVLDDEISDDLNHGGDDLYDALCFVCN
jgi:hypothetical protein